MKKFSLTPEQQKIVEFTGAPLRVVAGPGTGKTSCLIERVRFLIDKRKIKYQEICAITFTKSTSGELRERLMKSGIKSDEIPYVNTLHGLAMRILKKHQQRAGLVIGFKLASNIFTKVLIKDVVQDLRQRNILLSPSDLKIIKNGYFQNRAESTLPKIISDSQIRRSLEAFKKSFREHLEFYNAIDWVDILEKSIELIDSYPDIKVELHKMTQHLLVDEYQDLSRLEQCFVDKATGNPNGLCIVGDDDQSIYETFRFADPQGIIYFTKKYPRAGSLCISTCWRCPPKVIECALKLIQNNKKRVSKNLVPIKDKRGFVVLLSHKSKKAEKEWLVSKVQEIIKKGFREKDIMILFNDRDIAKDYVAALKDAGIILNIQLKISHIFESEAFVNLISTIRLLINSGDNLSLRQCLDYRKGIGPETVRQLRFLALSANNTLWEAIESVADNQRAFRKMKQRKQVAEFCYDFRELKKIERPSDIMCKFFSTFPDSREDNGCMIFSEYLKKFNEQENYVNLKEIFEDFEQNIESGILESKYQQDDKGVRVMTMHSAKGCESPMVIMPALEDDVIPGKAINIEERRRLFYVSVTRTKYGLYLSWASQRSGPEIHKVQGRQMLDKQKSRFLKEMGL